MRLHPLVPSAALLALASCASTPEPSIVRADALLGDFNQTEHTYEASASGSVWHPEELNYESPKDITGSKTFVHVTSHTMLLTTKEVMGLVGDARMGAWTIRTSRANVEKALKRHGARSEQSITLYPDQEGYITTMNQTAFVESFHMEASSTATIADPIIAVATEGSLLRTTGTPLADSGSVRIAAMFEMHDLASPIAEHEVMVPGAESPVTVQLPVTTHQSLRFTDELKPNEAIVGALPVTGEAGLMNVFFITAEMLRAEDQEVALVD